MSTSPERRRPRFSTRALGGQDLDGDRLGSRILHLSGEDLGERQIQSARIARGQPNATAGPLRTQPAATPPPPRKRMRDGSFGPRALLSMTTHPPPVGGSGPAGRPPGAFSTPIVPPWPAAISAAIANPRPVPALSSCPRQNRAAALDEVFVRKAGAVVAHDQCRPCRPPASVDTVTVVPDPA